MFGQPFINRSEQNPGESTAMAKLDHTKRLLKYEILGLVLLVLGLVVLGDLGAVGQSLDDLCVVLAGNWHFILPLYLIWIAGWIMAKRHRFRFTSLQTGILILLLVTLTWSELDLYSQAVKDFSSPPDLLTLTRTGINSLSASLRVLVQTRNGLMPPASAGGGMLGFALFTGLKYLFAYTGTMLVLVASALVGLVLVTHRSLVLTLGKSSKYFEKRIDKVWTQSVRGLARILSMETKRKQPDRRKTASVSERDKEAPRKRRRKDASFNGVQELDTVDALDTTLNTTPTTSFPFPDFGVPYREEPSYEQFVTDDHQTHEPEWSEALPIIDEEPEHEEHGRSEVAFETKAEEHRIIARLPEREFPELAPDPVPKASVNEPGAAAVVVRPYRLPDIRLLGRGDRGGEKLSSQKELQANALKLADTFESFGVHVKVLGYSRGPAVTRYEIQPATGVKVARILNLADDLALALAARDIRIEAPIPGKSAVGIEVPNQEVAIVTLRDVMDDLAFVEAKSPLTFVLGKDIAGKAIVSDLAKMPHLLVAGATGSGKSVCINGLISSLLFRAKPDEVKLIMIDPKMVELGVYNGIPHLFAPVVTDARKAAGALRKVVAEMEQRYERFHKARVRDLERYNQHAKSSGLPTLPLLVVIIDELADLMMVAPGDVEDAICRLAQMARAAGIHLVVATQRPSVDVITGLIKANIPSRIAFAVSSGVDSRTILDMVGAEKLLGRGDMLFMPVGASKPLRLQGAFISENEVEKLTDFIRKQQEAQYVEDFSQIEEDKVSVNADFDPLYDEAVKLVVESEQASVSYLQRKLKVGYARAARIVDQLEQSGVIGPFENSKPREVLLSREAWLERQSVE